MKTNKNLKNTFKETVKPTSQQLKELVQSLGSDNAAQKLKQTQTSLTNAGYSQSQATTSVNKANSIGSGNTSLSGTVGTIGTNTGNSKNLVESWEKEKAAQERINRQQAQSFNAIGSTNKQTNNNSGGSLQGLSALNRALGTYSRSTSVKEPTTVSRTTSTALNTVSSIDPATATTKSSGATTAKPADGLYYDAGNGSYTRVVNGNPYKVTYKDARYGAIRNEYNRTHTSNITYDMDSKGIITKYVNDTPYMVRPNDARYNRVANEFLATNIGDKTDRGIRDLANKYPALQVNWRDNGGDDTITIGLRNTREPLITLTDEYEDGTYTSPNGIITCKLQKGGRYVIAANRLAKANASSNNQAVTTEQTNTSLDRYTNRSQMVSRDGSIDEKRVAALTGSATAGATGSTWAVPGTKSLEMDNIGDITRTMTNGKTYMASVGNSEQYKSVLKEYLANKPGEGLRDLLLGTRVRVNWDNKNKIVTIGYTTTTTRQEVTLVKLTDADGDGTYTTDDGILSCKLQNGKMVIASKPSGSINNTNLDTMLGIQMKHNPQIQKNDRWVDANSDEVLQYLDPDNYCQGVYKYQFLDLSASAGISEEDMEGFLKDKGILAGKQDIYLQAAVKYNVSEIYLAAHSALETGNGTSKLANGVIINGVTVYNMYGIGAYDSDPVRSGAEYAYKIGWTTPEKAIAGGAKWISEQYINNPLYKQNTLYKMRWNPDSPGNHQYATDIAWAVKQTYSIKKMYDNFYNATLKFDISEF